MNGQIKENINMSSQGFRQGGGARTRTPPPHSATKGDTPAPLVVGKEYKNKPDILLSFQVK